MRSGTETYSGLVSETALVCGLIDVQCTTRDPPRPATINLAAGQCTTSQDAHVLGLENGWHGNAGVAASSFTCRD
jgi:hypothetical protein